MTPEDRAEVERIADEASTPRAVGCLTYIVVMALAVIVSVVCKDFYHRITALEAQVRELQGGKKP